MQNKNSNQTGSIVTYILAAMFLMGLLIATLSQTTQKRGDSSQVEKDFQYLKSDIDSIHAAVAECLQTYPERADVNNDNVVNDDDNPNPPFPLYEGLTSGNTGETITKIKCPAAPASNNSVFADDHDSRITILYNTLVYTTQYFNDATNGVYMRISSSVHDDLWREVISRINNSFSKCSAEIVTNGGDCVGGCLYYWFSRPDTNTIGDEEGCH